MLQFEFVQPGEFDDPWYEVTDGAAIGGLYFIDGKWKWSDNNEFYLESNELLEIAIKLDELNGAETW